MEQELETMYSFVMKRDGEIVGGQSSLLSDEEVKGIANHYKRAYQANEILVYVFNSRTLSFNLDNELSIIEDKECPNCKNTSKLLGVPGEYCPNCPPGF